MIKKEYTEKLVENFLMFKEQSVKLSTLTNYQIKMYKYFVPFLPQIAKKIDEKSCLELFDYFEDEELENKTINDILVLLNQFLVYIYEKKYNKHLIKVPLRKVTKKKMEIFTRDERRKLKDYLIEHLNYFNFAVLLTTYTGIRLGELASLQFKDLKDGFVNIDFGLQRVKNFKHLGNSKTIVIKTTPKSKESIRNIPIRDFILEILEKLSYEKEAYIVTGRKQQLDMRTIQRRFKKICILCGIPEKNIHILRHTFATYLLEDGMPLEAVSRLLGHANVRQTERYLHLSDDFLKKNIEKTNES